MEEAKETSTPQKNGEKQDVQKKKGSSKGQKTIRRREADRYGKKGVQGISRWTKGQEINEQLERCNEVRRGRNWVRK